MKVYLYPPYVSLSSVEAESEELCRVLKERGISLEEEHWGGHLDSLPTDHPVVIRGSSVMNCSVAALKEFCQKHGHLCFYYNSVWGTASGDTNVGLAKATEDFLDRNPEKKLSRTEVIEFLKSDSPDRSTLEEAKYAARQAKLALELFDEFVLGQQDRETQQNVSYPEIKVPGFGLDFVKEPGQVIPGFDSEGIKALKSALEDDVKALAGIGLRPLDNDSRARAYCLKLREGLSANLFQLEMSTEGLNFSYGMMGMAESIGAGVAALPIVMATFKSRHGSWGITTAVSALYRALLPILLEKLEKVGYAAMHDPTA